MTHLVREEGQLPERCAAIGPGWADIVGDLNGRLASLTPPARATCVLDSGGTAALILYDPQQRPGTRALCDEAERALFRTCERCGGPGTIRAGALLRIMCNACEDGRRADYWPM